MLLHRHLISERARAELSQYTREMANILGMTCTVEGQQVPVLDKSGWMQSLREDSSDLQIQKFIFAWMHIRKQYKSILPSKKRPEEIFEHNCMQALNLVYCPKQLQTMKKNEKTCIQLLYAVKERNWKESLLLAMKEHLQLCPSISAPTAVRKGQRDYRRQESTFFIGNWNKEDKRFHSWKTVRNNNSANSNSIEMTLLTTVVLLCF